ncbi:MULTISPECIES: hypothetical protein [Actinomycetes]|uniref:hypothetical protein n=1 Tax=Actinomycetes TaxID=1760 RepID=UPI00068F59FD|nr:MULTISPECIES: hypothetical protein [Actinomycetes]
MFDMRGMAPTVRIFTPPRPVMVDMIAALGWAFPMVGARPVTLAERAYGLRIEHYQAGEQLAWALSSRGVWMGVVRVDIASTNAAVTVTSCLWVPAEAITLRWVGTPNK